MDFCRLPFNATNSAEVNFTDRVSNGNWTIEEREAMITSGSKNNAENDFDKCSEFEHRASSPYTHSVQSTDFFKTKLQIPASTPIPSEQSDSEEEPTDATLRPDLDMYDEDTMSQTDLDKRFTPNTSSSTDMPSLVRIEPFADTFNYKPLNETDDNDTGQLNENHDIGTLTFLNSSNESNLNDEKVEHQLNEICDIDTLTFLNSSNECELNAEPVDEQEQSVEIQEDPANLEFQSDTEDGCDNIQDKETLVGQTTHNDSLEAISSCPEDYSYQTLREDKDSSEERDVNFNLKTYIQSLPPDDFVFLTGFPEINRDPKFVLPYQKVRSTEIGIHIAEVFSPVHFWFHYEHEIEKLMAMLQKDYNNLTDRQLTISDCNITPGLLVACYLKEYDKWHRALVINQIDDKDRVRMLMVDYGTVGKVHKRRIKFLFKSYLRYPRYSLRGRLVNIKPPNKERMWAEKEVDSFLAFVGGRELNATVKRYDERYSIYELDITVKSHRVNQSLNDWLVSRCLAAPFKLKPTSINPSCYHFPSFEMLETNYPTYHEQSLLLTDNIDYEMLVQTNFFTCLSEEMVKTTPALLRMLGNKKFQDVKNYYYPGNE